MKRPKVHNYCQYVFILTLFKMYSNSVGELIYKKHYYIKILFKFSVASNYAKYHSLSNKIISQGN